MIERNESRYQIEQNNKIYILSTSLIGDKIKLFCQDSNSQVYEGQFGMNDLIKLSKYFHPNHKVEQIQMYLNGIIEKQRVGINQNDSTITIILFLINKDTINLPIPKKLANISYNFNNLQNFNNPQNIQAQNQFIQNQQKNNLMVMGQPQFILNNTNPQILNLQNQKQIQYFQNTQQKKRNSYK